MLSNAIEALGGSALALVMPSPAAERNSNAAARGRYDVIPVGPVVYVGEEIRKGPFEAPVRQAVRRSGFVFSRFVREGAGGCEVVGPGGRGCHGVF